MNMPKEIIFHLGFPKTATTFLQKYIFTQLSDWVVVDPFFNNTDLYKKFAKDFNYFNNEEFENKKIVVSSEYLADPFRNHNYNLLFMDFIKINYNNPKTILFTRNKLDIINSLFLQSVKTGSAISSRKFRKQRKILSLDETNFEVLPKEVDYLFSFEEFKENSLEVIDELSKIFNHLLVYQGDKNTNTSFGYLSTSISLFLNPFFRSMNNPHGLIPLPYRHTHLFTYLRRFKWYRNIDKKKHYFKDEKT